MMYDDCAGYIQRVSKLTELLHGKWKLEILCAMRNEPVRLSQLQRLMPSASKKGLRASLRSLESTGIVVRRDLSVTVLHVEYDFADDMRQVMCSLLDAMADWGTIFEARRKDPVSSPSPAKRDAE